MKKGNMHMKVKLIAVAMAVVAFAGVASAQMPAKCDYLQLAYPKKYTNGTLYSAASSTNGYNLTAYNGFAKLIVTVSGDEGTVASTNGTIVLQHSALETGTYSTVTALSSYMPTLTTTGKCAVVDVDLETLKNWCRVAVTQSSMGETNCAHTVGAVLVVPHKND
jgi:hypothetical protein